MNEMTLFNGIFGDVRAINVDGKAWFVAKDVAEALGYKDTDGAVRKHCKSVNTSPVKTAGQVRNMKIVNEYDVIRLIMKSRLPQAEQFEKWIIEDVIPSVLKTGSYSIHNEEPAPLALTYDEEMMLKGYRQIVDGNALGYAQTFKDYGDTKKVEGRKEIANSGIITQKDIVSLIKNTYPEEFDSIPFDVRYTCGYNWTNSLFMTFLIDKKYIYKDYVLNATGDDYEKQKASFPTEKFAELTSRQYAAVQYYKDSNGNDRDKCKLVFYGTIEELIKSEDFRLAFFQWAGVIKGSKKYDMFTNK